MKKSERIFEFFFIAVIMFFFFTIGVRVFTKLVVVDRLGVANEFTKLVFFDAPKLNDAALRFENYSIDWATIYPFDKEAEEKTPSRNTENSLVIIPNKFIAFRDYLETYATDFLFGNNRITELEKKYEKIVFLNDASFSEPNDLVRTSDGYWTFICEELDVAEQAKSVAEFSAFCRSLNVPLIYVNAPTKTCKYYDFEILNALDFSNKNADDLLSALKDLGVENFDLREILHEEGRAHHEMFFVADHHWRPESGLWAARKISEILNLKVEGKIDISLLEENNFSKKIFRRWFLGSQGKKVTLANAKPEDFCLLFPRRYTNFHYEVKNKKIDANGDFSIFYNTDYFKKRNFYGPSVYNAYIYGDQPLEIIENNLADNDERVLVVHDSYGDVVVPFLALGVRRVDSIDMRYFNGSLKTYIKKERPDVVVALYYSSSMIDKRKYNFE